MRRPSSRIAGFYLRPLAERRQIALRLELLDAESRAWLERGGGLDLERADRMSENVVGVIGLPMGLALNLRVNGADHLVAMAVEEPSVVAAASNAARLVRLGGGFHGEADAPVMTCQVQLDDTYASQFHARIYRRDGSWFVEDLGSTNGTYLNQRRLTAPAEVRAGDRLRIGKTTLELRR